MLYAQNSFTFGRRFPLQELEIIAIELVVFSPKSPFFSLNSVMTKYLVS